MVVRLAFSGEFLCASGGLGRGGNRDKCPTRCLDRLLACCIGRLPVLNYKVTNSLYLASQITYFHKIWRGAIAPRHLSHRALNFTEPAQYRNGEWALLRRILLAFIIRCLCASDGAGWKCLARRRMDSASAQARLLSRWLSSMAHHLANGGGSGHLRPLCEKHNTAGGALRFIHGEKPRNQLPMDCNSSNLTTTMARDGGLKRRLSRPGVSAAVTELEMVTPRVSSLGILFVSCHA